MDVDRIVFSIYPFEEDVMLVTLYQNKVERQLGLLNISRFINNMSCSVYDVYKTYLDEITNHTLLYIDLLQENRGIIFTYENQLQIEYRNTYFTLSDPFFRYLFDNYVYRDEYKEKLKSLKRTKKSDTL